MKIEEMYTSALIVGDDTAKTKLHICNKCGAFVYEYQTHYTYHVERGDIVREY